MKPMLAVVVALIAAVSASAADAAAPVAKIKGEILTCEPVPEHLGCNVVVHAVAFASGSGAGTITFDGNRYRVTGVVFIAARNAWCIDATRIRSNLPDPNFAQLPFANFYFSDVGDGITSIDTVAPTFSNNTHFSCTELLAVFPTLTLFPALSGDLDVVAH
jgi:hypothetical protein